jgi:inorganic pyrophosphatase
MRVDAHFWHVLEKLAAASTIVIDRPRGSSHPRYAGLIYPLDYGYLEGTRSGDGAGIDVWIGSLPTKRVTGVIISVDAEKRDAEVKVLISCTHVEAEVILAFHNDGEQGAILVEREEEQLPHR